MTDSRDRPLQSDNKILSSLPPSEFKSISRKLEKVALTFEEQIYNPGEPIGHVYFPLSGMVSLIVNVDRDLSAEVGLVGREGFVGLPLFLGVGTSDTRAVIQGGGAAMRMTAGDFTMECERGGALPGLLRRFAHSRLTQASQSAVCYRFHASEARLAKWLLLMSDRMEADEFPITQQFLASMLGVRREAVNRSAGLLERRGLISHSRRLISITDRAGLEKMTCSCYELISREERGAPPADTQRG